MSLCQYTTQFGPCKNEAPEGFQYCETHNTIEKEQKERKKVFNYQLTRFKSRFEELSTNSALKTLSEEVGVLRMVLETCLNRCKDEHDLLLASTQISTLVNSIERLVMSTNKLDINLGQLLDRNKAIQLADEIIQIIVAEVQDEEAVAKVAAQITAAMNRITVAP